MTGKYKVTVEDLYIELKKLVENGDGDKPLCSIENDLMIVDLLNELADENKQLKESVYSWSKSYNRVYEENTNIKHTIKTMMENERTELGQSVLKQLWEQIE